MTDPVDTDALRALVNQHNDLDPLGHQMWELAARSSLRAAADEVGRLRVRCEHLDGEHEQVKANRDQIIVDYQRLRAVIENAPHDADCWLLEDPDEGVLPSHRRCTCWKADAL